MFDEYIYIVKVYENDEPYKYEYGNLKHAVDHCKMEFYKGNKVILFRLKDDILERYNGRTNTWG